VNVFYMVKKNIDFFNNSNFYDFINLKRILSSSYFI